MSTLFPIFCIALLLICLLGAMWWSGYSYQKELDERDREWELKGRPMPEFKPSTETSLERRLKNLEWKANYDPDDYDIV